MTNQLTIADRLRKHPILMSAFGITAGWVTADSGRFIFHSLQDSVRIDAAKQSGIIGTFDSHFKNLDDNTKSVYEISINEDRTILDRATAIHDKDKIKEIESRLQGPELRSKIARSVICTIIEKDASGNERNSLSIHLDPLSRAEQAAFSKSQIGTNAQR